MFFISIVTVACVVYLVEKYFVLSNHCLLMSFFLGRGRKYKSSKNNSSLSVSVPRYEFILGRKSWNFELITHSLFDLSIMMKTPVLNSKIYLYCTLTIKRCTGFQLHSVW